MTSTAIALLASFFLSWWLVDHVSLPFVWIALVAVACCAWNGRRATMTAAKLVWLNVAVAAIVLGVLEIYLWATAPETPVFDRATPASACYVDHLDYGYAPLGPCRTRITKLYAGEPIYSVVYTFDDRGFRVAPPEAPLPERLGCVLFFGGSHTLGEGVEDDQSMPWQVGRKTGGRFAIRNLSFHGWGPHQMLSALESGNAERSVGCRVTHVVYLALYWHASRVAGRSWWDPNGPRYVLDQNGRAVRAGYFSDVRLRGYVPRRILYRLEKSFIYQKYLMARLDPYKAPIGPRDVDLFVAVIDKSREEVAARFPGASFHVFVSDVSRSLPMAGDLAERIAALGIDVHRVSDAIPDYRQPSDPRYGLSPADTHPSPAAYDRMSDYVVKEILGYSPP